MVGVSAKSIQRYEEATQMPRMRTLERLGQVLGIRLEEFFQENPSAQAAPSLTELAAGQKALMERLDELSRALDRLVTLIETEQKRRRKKP